MLSLDIFPWKGSLLVSLRSATDGAIQSTESFYYKPGSQRGFSSLLIP
jgi:hypothetical protein